MGAAEQPFYGLAHEGRTEPFVQFDTMREALAARPMFHGSVIVHREGRRWRQVEPFSDMVSADGPSF
jgi:hypothetical protein